jgi:hypothetical protein
MRGHGHPETDGEQGPPHPLPDPGRRQGPARSSPPGAGDHDVAGTGSLPGHATPLPGHLLVGQQAEEARVHCGSAGGSSG